MGQTKEIQETTPYGDTFITYRGHRIFYKWKMRHFNWFAVIYKNGIEASKNYPCLGSEWFWTRADCIKWGKALIDEYLGSPKEKEKPSALIEYRDYRIFCVWKKRHRAWLAIAYKSEAEFIKKLGCKWLSSRSAGIKWGKQIIDKQLG